MDAPTPVQLSGPIFNLVNCTRLNAVVFGIIVLVMVQIIETADDLIANNSLSFIRARYLALPLCLVLLVIFTRGLQRDLASISHLFPDQKQLNPRTPWLIKSYYAQIPLLFLGIVLSHALMVQALVVINQWHFSYFFLLRQNFNLLLFSGGLTLGIGEWISFLVNTTWGWVFVNLWAIAFFTTRTVNDFAKQVPFQLFTTAKLAMFGNAFLRGLLLWVIFLSLFLYNLTHKDGTNISLYIGAPILSLVTVFVLILGLPLYTLQKRIKTLKNDEIARVEMTLEGDEQALKRSPAGKELIRISYVELLTYRQQLQSVWDWPIHQHAQRIFFYLIIPPITWALAALVAKLIG